MTIFRTTIACLGAAAALLHAACGGGGGSDAEAVGDGAEGPTTEVAGTFVATDGVTPLGSALVYVEGGKSRDSLPPAAAPCGAPPDPSWPATCTAADGSFSFEIVLPEGDARLVMTKNGFTQTSTLASGRPTRLPLGKVSLGGGTAGSRIAVVFGDDGMQHVLTRLGMGTMDAAQNLVYGTEPFDLFDSELGDDSTQARRQYPSWELLFTDDDGDGKVGMHQYAMVVLNGGLYTKVRENAAYREALRRYVEEGGRVITMGMGFLLIEDIWPTYLDWAEAETPAEEPERPVGVRSESFYVPVYGKPDVPLYNWMAGVTCARYLTAIETGSCFDLLSDSAFAVDGVPTQVLPNFYPRLLGPHPQSAGAVRTLVQGYTQIEGGLSATHPLAVVLSIGKGRIGYSSFQIAPVALVTEGITPHERMFQYMVFEM